MFAVDVLCPFCTGCVMFPIEKRGRISYQYEVYLRYMILKPHYTCRTRLLVIVEAFTVRCLLCCHASSCVDALFETCPGMTAPLADSSLWHSSCSFSTWIFCPVRAIYIYVDVYMLYTYMYIYDIIYVCKYMYVCMHVSVYVCATSIILLNHGCVYVYMPLRHYGSRVPAKQGA